MTRGEAILELTYLLTCMGSNDAVEMAINALAMYDEDVVLSFKDFKEVCLYHSTQMIDYDEQESICVKPDRIPNGHSCAECNARVCPYCTARKENDT